jgi:nucleoside-diphosphate-sugar epimerase
MAWYFVAMRILVIGGSGFIGTFVVAELAKEGHQIAVFHRGTTALQKNVNVEQVIGNRSTLMEQANALRNFRPEAVVDMILSSGKQASELMDTFRGVADRVVALSSMDVYRACGILHRLEESSLVPVPLTEDSLLRSKLKTYPPEQINALKGVFGWLDAEYDKIPVEREILSDSALPGTILRLPMVYGPGDPLNRLLPLVKRMEEGRPAIIFTESMAAWRGCRGYVENVASAVVLATTSEAAVGRIYNVAERNTPTELEWAHSVANVVGWTGKFVVMQDDRAPVHLRSPANLTQHWVADSSRIREELDYNEPVSSDVGLARTVEWTKANQNVSGNMYSFDYAAEDDALSQGNQAEIRGR